MSPRPIIVCQICATEVVATKRTQKRCRNPECTREAKRRHMRAWYHASEQNKDKQSKRSLTSTRKRLYGVTNQQVAELLSAQNGVCAICAGICVNGRHLSIDHCHASGKIRGLLCARCNLTLGKFNDDPALLRRAADYLEVTANVAPIHQ